MYHANAIYALPDNVSLEVGALLEPVTVAVHTVDIADIHPGATVAILGGGPIGILILMVAKIAGAAKILVSEPVESRRKLAEQLGATVTVDPINENLEEVSMKPEGLTGLSMPAASWWLPNRLSTLPTGAQQLSGQRCIRSVPR
jgi:(R,R)-butanediol dehydrogenase/meso-butanediol dehydrogenase/diacetyl reductase